MIGSVSPLLAFLDRVLDGIEARVVAPLAARFYQLAPHCSGCGGPPAYDPLDCEGCMPVPDADDDGLGADTRAMGLIRMS